MFVGKICGFADVFFKIEQLHAVRVDPRVGIANSQAVFELEAGVGPASVMHELPWSVTNDPSVLAIGPAELGVVVFILIRR